MTMKPIEWSSPNSCVTLVEHVDTRGEPARAIEFIRVQPENPPDLPPYYNLSIVTEGEDMSFGRMSAQEVCQMAQDMIRLVGGIPRVDPPVDPEIRF
jgi:hypothetical protein